MTSPDLPETVVNEIRARAEHAGEGANAAKTLRLLDELARLRERAQTAERNLDDWNENRELLEYPCNCQYCVVEWVRKTDLTDAQARIAELEAGEACTVEERAVLQCLKGQKRKDLEFLVRCGSGPLLEVARLALKIDLASDRKREAESQEPTE